MLVPSGWNLFTSFLCLDNSLLTFSCQLSWYLLSGRYTSICSQSILCICLPPFQNVTREYFPWAHRAHDNTGKYWLCNKSMISEGINYWLLQVTITYFKHTISMPQTIFPYELFQYFNIPPHHQRQWKLCPKSHQYLVAGQQLKFNFSDSYQKRLLLFPPTPGQELSLICSKINYRIRLLKSKNAYCILIPIFHLNIKIKSSGSKRILF